ncbi:hypothetical protein [Sphingobacterium sp. UBA1498]|uniref:hypothetical protein n=1 Tax=Sphingobacterium sp. UBA1498 TaxID=1947481 RepID=UPI0025E814BC|nr:hypothetical protein [Sphingobacterium sp. UBA1498]
MKKKLLLILFFYFTQVIYGQTKRDFLVFDAIMIKEKENLYKYGFSKINMIYEDSLLVINRSSPNNPNMRLFDNTKFRRSQRYIDSKFPICVDIERWTLYEKDLDTNIPKFLNVTNIFKQKYPSTDFGFYGVLPFADLYIYDKVGPLKKDFLGRSWLNKKGEDWWSTWNKINNQMSAIARKNEIAFPSCYTRFKDKDSWLQATKLQVQMIRKLNPKIKIYAFLWPQYYAKGTSADEQYIEDDFWNFQLENIYKLCDGAVIWMPPFNSSDRKKINWNRNQSWLVTTKKFLNKYSIKSNIQ